MALLSLQFAFQPFLTRRYAPTTICRSTFVLMQELLKLLLSFLMLRASGSYKTSVANWTVGTWIRVAFVPAALYAVQGMCALMAYQTLEALTFNVLNQTKTLSAALCCYLVMRRRQSCMQVFSLFVLLASALVMEKMIPLDLSYYYNYNGDDGGGGDDAALLVEAATTMAAAVTEQLELEAEAAELHARNAAHRWTHGVVPILLASFISGLAGALVQKNLQSQGGGRNSYLLTMELSAASALILLFSLVMSPDGETIRKDGFWKGWMPVTWIPILTQSLGGIVVGLVTKHAGSVRKGFALIFGMFLSGLVQTFATKDGVSIEQSVGGLLAAVSLWMHVSNPYVDDEERELQQQNKTGGKWKDVLTDDDDIEEPLLHRYVFPGPR